MANALPELPVAEATGIEKAIFAEIVATNRVPMVALIYRHLGALPGTLAWAWSALGPAMRDGTVAAAADTLAEGPTALPALALPAAAALDLRPIDVAAIRYVAAAFNTANPQNLIAARTLRRLLEAPEAARAGAPEAVTGGITIAARYPALPPMVAYADMPDALQARLRPLLGATPAIVPSLYRHLAHWPAFLAAAAEAIAPVLADGAFAAAVEDLSRRADGPVAALEARARETDFAAGRPAPPDAMRLRETLDDFARVIPEMIVIGGLIARGFDER